MSWQNIFTQLVFSCTLGFLNLGGGYGSRNLSCDMLIAIDEPLYRAMYNEDVMKTTAVAEEYIRKLNEVYQR